jgi:hypothetical protein
MSLIQKAQQLVDVTPAPVSWSVMLGSLVMSVLQPLAIGITLMWGCLQIHGWVEKRWGHDFLWLNRLFGKGK